MTPTWIGLLIVLIGGLLMVRGSIMAMFTLVLICSMLGGSAAVQLPALGGSSIPPAYVALGFLVLRIVLAPGPTRRLIGEAVSANVPLVIFCLYGAIGALILPRIFEGALEVTPMNPTSIRYLLDADPLQFSSQNLTSATYLIGTLLAAVSAWIVTRSPDAGFQLTGLIGHLTLLHVVTGLVALALVSAGRTDVIEIVRNGNYAQLDQNYRGLLRIAGFFPETSGYAAYGIPLVIATTEMWLRDLRPKLTGPAALALFAVLMFSTSSTAYVGLAAYLGVLVLRLLMFPTALNPRKILALFILACGAAVLVLVIALALPRFAGTFTDMLTAMTVNKGDSLSGMQRQFWARQGLEAFQVSWGVGVGAGSFRSSSLITAIAGSMGVIGLFCFAVHLWRVLRPLRASTYGVNGQTAAQSVGAALGWAACIGLVPAMVASASPDPGLMFGLLGGLALGLRTLPREVEAVAPPGEFPSSASRAGPAQFRSSEQFV